MSCQTLENIVCVAALYIGLKLAMPLLNCLKALISAPTNVGELGDWALVTGSTDGIGKAYACALAEQGLNIVLVSRSPVKLEHVASEIETKYKVKTKTVDIDYSSSDEKYIPRLEEDLKDLEIGVLVNNVGMSYQFPDEFLALGNKRMKDMIAINITALNAMTRLVLPGMEKRGKGAIINIGSIASAVPFPMLAVYAATKAYVDKFTYALNQEYGRKGIVIQVGINQIMISQKFYKYSPNCFHT
jgi:17beta-estradiol 17-dehydrogenase / very-long-chain 3-oxoacyl-CoA reductase